MTKDEIRDRIQNLVRGENARNMTRDNLVSTFVEVPSFRELLSPKNHIVLGSRGSGKTALAKMLSHDYLSCLAERGSSVAKPIANERKYIGIYLSTRNEWVGSLKNKSWSDENEKIEHFQWKLNISTCKALLTTLRSCLTFYIPNKKKRIEAERDVIKELSDSWLPAKEEARSVSDMRSTLEDIEWKKEVGYAEKRVLSTNREELAPAFATNLFTPLKRGIKLIKRSLDRGLGSSIWFLCIDEAEFLDEKHHQALNTHLRADSGDLAFKITTTPYGHHTTDTFSNAPVRNGHDFEYLYISKRRPPHKQEEFVTKLFSRLTKSISNGYLFEDDITLDRLLGGSELLESKSSSWSLESDKMELLKKHSTQRFYRRAVDLKKNDEEEQFRSSIVRKVHGLIKLRESTKSSRGATKLSTYSGWRMLARCGEENPRHILRLLKRMISQYDSDGLDSGSPLIPKVKQNEIFRQYSARELERTKTEPNCREKLHDLLSTLGSYSRHYFLERDFTGDVVSAYKIKRGDPDEYWDLTKRAVQWGLLFPKVNKSNKNDLPRKEGVFHLSNVLAPGFDLLPRRGKAHRLSTILSKSPPTDDPSVGEQLELDLT
jgi:hypothetical protein